MGDQALLRSRRCPQLQEEGADNANDCRVARSSSEQKVFKPRTSLANHLYETDPHVRGLYNVCVVHILLLLACVVIRDSYAAGRPCVDLTLVHILVGSVADVAKFIGLEVVQLAGAFLVYPVFQTWASMRNHCGSVLFILLYCVYVIGSWFGVVSVIWTLSFPPVLRVISTVEQMRLCMKSYSFLRENAHKVVHPWTKDDESGPAVLYAGQMEPKVGSFSQYLYFVFAPTLLYRDNYPRESGSINWWRAVVYFLQFLSTTVCALVLFREVLFPKSLHLDDLVESLVRCILLGFVELTLAHTCLMHTWMNFGAEITCFADRQFYSDWWNCKNYATYYRKWNMPIYDWLHVYIYRDLRQVVHSPLAAVFPVFLVSSLFHDYHISMGVGFFAPVFLVMFAGIGVALFIVRPFGSRVAHLFTISGLTIGGGLVMWTYLVEIAARRLCPADNSYFTFRTPDCYAQFN